MSDIIKSMNQMPSWKQRAIVGQLLMVVWALNCLCWLTGCESNPRAIPTPKREMQCPICLEPALLRDFSEYDASYDCEKHYVKFNRRSGEFERAWPKPDGPNGAR